MKTKKPDEKPVAPVAKPQTPTIPVCPICHQNALHCACQDNALKK